ncbi:hypothetical protein NDK50_22975 [Paraburkholderia bryophila]|uniref:hypothetical protein n=1 Tax=Paraburkholderia bryophila TaxID=420952 RepID=UPI00234BC5B1|nr:hypothetical protein [Paraburkholderia bryophila]WCM23718.1 hypothetical protein NDK50_22975 [Paraburkholderia bryophila]
MKLKLQLPNLATEVRGAVTCGADTLLRLRVSDFLCRGLRHDAGRSGDDQSERDQKFILHLDA